MLGNVLLFFYCLSLSITGLKSFDNVIIGCSVLYLFYLYRNKFLSELLKINGSVVKAYMCFLGSIFITSVMILDFKSIKISLNFLYYTLPFLIVYLLVKAIHNVKWGIYGYGVGLAVICSYDFYEYIISGKNRLGIMFGHPNLDASMIEMLLPLCILYIAHLYEKNKYSFVDIFLVVAIILGIISLFLTKSRGAIIGSVTGLFFTTIIYCYKYYNSKYLPKILGSVLVVCAVGLFGIYNDNNGSFSRRYDNERLLLIESSYRMWNDNKVFGVGLANWKKEYDENYILPNAKEPRLTFPHNVYAYYFSTTGLIGGFGFLGFLYLITRYLFKEVNVYQINGMISIAVLWILLSISFHGFVDGGLVLKKCFKLFCGILGMVASLNDINFLKNNDK